MPYLLITSLLWAFSFGLTKGLTSGLDGTFVACARLGLALLVFLPFLRLKDLTPRIAATLIGIGAIQFGLMYLAYNESFKHLQSHEVALFTLTTPVFVTLLADAFDRRFRYRALTATLLAIVGTGLIVFQEKDLRPTLTGLAMIQLSNLAFALGQIGYKRLRAQPSTLRDRDIFALLYLGGFVLTLPFTLAKLDFASFAITRVQLLTLIYLGTVASGIGFFLWNLGATRVKAGTLAVMNNAKIPLAVACSFLFFGESSAQLPLLFLSLGILLVAVWLADSSDRKSTEAEKRNS